MIYVYKISEEEKLSLDNINKNHASSILRMRAHSVLLSSNGFKVKEIADIITVCRQTIATWLRGWNKEGLLGLFDKPRSGRPCESTINKISKEEKLSLASMNKNHPSSLLRIRAQFVLLSDKGFKVKEIADIMLVSRHTIVIWLRRWEENGISGLFDLPRTGRSYTVIANGIN